MMTQEEITKAVEGVMALRPADPKISVAGYRNPETVKRLNDYQFKKEIEAILQDELTVSGSPYFFNNMDATKGGRKNLTFNPYYGEVKR